MIIGFVGFGEVSLCFSKGLSEYGEVKVLGYDVDIQHAKSRSQDLKNVEIVDSIVELLERTKYIIIAVPGKCDASVFDEILSNRIEDHLFMDLSTALPCFKESISEKVYGKKAMYIDVAVLGSVPKLLQKTLMLISGEGSEEMVRLFERYGMDLTVCSKIVGKASTIKLCRSVFMKGLPALLIETIRICKQYGVENEVISSIYKNLAGQDFETFCNRLIDGAYRHRIRQKDELDECLEIGKEVGMELPMTKAAIRIFESLENQNEKL